MKLGNNNTQLCWFHSIIWNVLVLQELLNLHNYTILLWEGEIPAHSRLQYMFCKRCTNVLQKKDPLCTRTKWQYWKFPDLTTAIIKVSILMFFCCHHQIIRQCFDSHMHGQPKLFKKLLLQLITQWKGQCNVFLYKWVCISSWVNAHRKNFPVSPKYTWMYCMHAFSQLVLMVV